MTPGKTELSAENNIVAIPLTRRPVDIYKMNNDLDSKY